MSATQALDSGAATDALLLRIPAMDCAVEGGQIRRTLEGFERVRGLRFDLPARRGRLNINALKTVAVGTPLLLGWPWLDAVYKALVLLVFDNASMWMAVFADMDASLLVVINGLRLLRPYHGR